MIKIPRRGQESYPDCADTPTATRAGPFDTNLVAHPPALAPMGCDHPDRHWDMGQGEGSIAFIRDGTVRRRDADPVAVAARRRQSTHRVLSWSGDVLEDMVSDYAVLVRSFDRGAVQGPRRPQNGQVCVGQMVRRRSERTVIVAAWRTGKKGQTNETTGAQKEARRGPSDPSLAFLCQKDTKPGSVLETKPACP
jgi:hypothetical protein